MPGGNAITLLNRASPECPPSVPGQKVRNRLRRKTVELIGLGANSNTNNKMPMNTKSLAKSKRPAFAIRIHLTDGSVESFAPTNEADAQKLWDRIEPSRLFAQSRLVLAGEHFKSVFATAQILRVDFIQDTYECWKFPGGYSDVVELSE